LLGYNVYRTQRTDTEFERLLGIENTSFSTGKSTFIDSNLIAGSIYFYRISVVTTKGESDQSAFVSATVQLDNRPPNAPNFLEGEAVVGDPEKLDLTWAPPTTDYDGSIITGVALYNVYRADVATGPFEKVAATIVAAYQDTGLSSVTTYYYRVTAVDNSGNSSLNSSSIGVTTGGVARPSGVKISASTPSSLAEPPEVSLSWEKSVGAILYYEIERTAIENSNSDEDYTAIGDNTLNTAFVDNTVSRARIYYYRIRARDVDDRVSEWTEIVSVEVKN
jgi:fibronectin type 3 domain-containing protein